MDPSIVCKFLDRIMLSLATSAHFWISIQKDLDLFCLEVLITYLCSSKALLKTCHFESILAIDAFVCILLIQRLSSSR